MRRTLTIIAIVIVLGGLAAFAYFYFFGSTASVTVAPTGGGSLPIAGPGTFPTGTATTSSSATPAAPTPVSARLVKISAGPVVPGEVVIDVPAANASSSPTIVVNYIERESGNVFSYSMRSNAITRINNKTIPGIQSAAWFPNGTLAFVRYLSGADFSTTNTYALAASSSATMGGFFLPQNLADVAVSATGVLSLASGVNGSVASLGNASNARASTVFATPLSAVRVSFAGKSRYLVYTKPSAGLAGAAFLVDATGFSRIAGPLDGLTALASPSGKWVLVNFVSDGAFQMEIVDTATGATTALPIATIADKCVWAVDDSAVYCGIPMSPPSGYAYPDDWYQGAVQFSDRLWKVDVAGRYAQLVLDFQKETGGTLDAEALAVDPATAELVFINKSDGSLWSYAL